ncbi:PKD domain-containing protein [Anaerolineales bacterium HSG24]|nr:PKD domain-containing protein [Anaerolineales bacterium HSG24]
MKLKSLIKLTTFAITQILLSMTALAKQRSITMKTIKVATFAVTLILLSLTALANTPTAHAQEPTSDNLELVGQIGGPTKAVFVEGNYAYIGVGPRLVILDVSNPTHPVEVGKSDVLPGIVNDITVHGEYAYIANDTDGGLQILNISDPTKPTFVGRYDTAGRARGVAVNGNYAYIANHRNADRKNGLQIINISDPTKPTLVGSYDVDNIAKKVRISGNYAYIVDWGHTAGLKIVDISDPANPTLASRYDVPGNVNDVTVNGNYAYIADHGNGLKIINITDPANPTLVGSYDDNLEAYGVTVSGNYAYLLGFTWGVLGIIDISDPTNPTLIGRYDIPTNVNGDNVDVTVAISGNYVYVADSRSWLHIINVSNSVTPTLAGKYDTLNSLIDVTVSDSYAYVTESGGINSGLGIINLNEPINPSLAGSHNSDTSFVDGVVISDSYAYMSTFNGLEIFDISNRTKPTLIGKDKSVHSSDDMAISDSYLYAVGTSGFLQIIDISDPTTTNLVSTYNAPDRVYGVVISETYAYLAVYKSGLQIIDISVPTNPILVGSYDTPDEAYSVAVKDGYVYVATQSYSGNVLQVIDVSDLTNPILVSNYDIGSYVSYDFGGSSRPYVTINGNYAYATDAGRGLHLLNISGPTSPTLITRYNTPGSAEHVTVRDNYVYVVDDDGGLVILRQKSTISTTPTALTLTPDMTQTLTITNAGLGSFNWTATVPTWLTLAPLSGTAPSTLTVSANSADMAPGIYTASIILSGDGVSNSPYTVPVTLTVPTKPVLTVSPMSLAYNLTAGDAPISQTVNISNTGTGVLSWTAESSAEWLTVTDLQGQNQTLKVSVDPSALTAGTYSATINISSNGGAAEIPVVVTVKDVPTPTPTHTATPSATPLPTHTPTPTVTPSPTAEPSVMPDLSRDTDGDALPDVWETEGYDHDGDGTIDVNLPAMGADPNRKDIFVEIDYMVEPGGLRHEPKSEAINKVVSAFANAPVSNPDGSTGISLHVDYGEKAVMNPQTGATWDNLSRADELPFKTYLQPTGSKWDWSGFNQYRDTQHYFDAARSPIFHYTIFAHKLGADRSGGTSGIASRPGDRLVVSFGGWNSLVGTVNEQAGTFMHELGHNLNLHHGGDDGINAKPNYLSIMNYTFQTKGLLVNGQGGFFDYTRAALPSLDEANLNEFTGLNSGGPFAGYGTRYYCRLNASSTLPIVGNGKVVDEIVWWRVNISNVSEGAACYQSETSQQIWCSVDVPTLNQPIDWDCSGNLNSDVQNSINDRRIGTPNTELEQFTSHDDWANIQFDGGLIGANKANRQTGEDVEDELTQEEDSLLYTAPYEIQLIGQADKLAQWGDNQALPVTISNTGRLTVTVDLVYTASQNSWFDLSRLPTQVTLPPNSQQSLPLTLTVPANPTSATEARLTIKATISQAPHMVDTVSINAKTGPVARYEVTTMADGVADSYQFTDNSIGTITAWAWNFGDGASSTDQNPTHTFTTSGLYNVTLTVSGTDGEDSITRAGLIRVASSAINTYLPIITK